MSGQLNDFGDRDEDWRDEFTTSKDRIVPRFKDVLAPSLAILLGGCTSFTVKTTGSERAGSEQLLLTGIADRAIECLDFGPLVGPHIFFDDSHIDAADEDWIAFTLRRAMARQGVLLVSEEDDAEVVVDAAVAAYGTDETDCRISLPSIAAIGSIPVPTSNTDAISRKNKQDAVLKLALTATDRHTHRLVWESGTILQTGTLDRRFLGNREVKRRSSLPELDAYPRH